MGGDSEFTATREPSSGPQRGHEGDRGGSSSRGGRGSSSSRGGRGGSSGRGGRGGSSGRGGSRAGSSSRGGSRGGSREDTSSRGGRVGSVGSQLTLAQVARLMNKMGYLKRNYPDWYKVCTKLRKIIHFENLLDPWKAFDKADAIRWMQRAKDLFAEDHVFSHAPGEFIYKLMLAFSVILPFPRTFP
jgi:hypothetical protein